jgi:hypothetical protein
MATVRPGFDGRDGAGRFARGNAIARGNPFARRMATLRQALLDSATPDDVQRVGRMLLGLAEAGDVAAAKVWLEYTVGRPPQALELSGPEGEPLSFDLSRLQSVLLGALASYPEAKVAVAAALKGLADDTRDVERPGDGPRPEPADGGPGSDPGPLADEGPALFG